MRVRMLRKAAGVVRLGTLAGIPFCLSERSEQSLLPALATGWNCACRIGKPLSFFLFVFPVLSTVPHSRGLAHPPSNPPHGRFWETQLPLADSQQPQESSQCGLSPGQYLRGAECRIRALPGRSRNGRALPLRSCLAREKFFSVCPGGEYEWNQTPARFRSAPRRRPGPAPPQDQTPVCPCRARGET